MMDTAREAGTPEKADGVGSNGVEDGTRPAAQEHSVRVAVLGGGMSGLCMGALLKRHGYDDFVILEKADSVGGTWRENTYPGIACDVPSHLYSFSFDLNPNWSHSYGSGPEIWAYCKQMAEKFGLGSHLRLGTEVTAARFEGDRWTVDTKDGTRYRADIVVSGLGGLHLPKHPEIAGLDQFAGTRFHTAEWRHDHDLTGRKVAIIGTGASAVQVLPNIAPIVSDVTVFQRSPAWVFPRLTRDISDETRARFRRFPWLMRLYRTYLWSLLDAVGMLSLSRGGMLAERYKLAGLRFLEQEVADPDTRAKLTPDYEPGCKRRCISDDYLCAYNRDNVHLVTTPIERIEAGGIRDRDGVLHEVDTIIEATGFRPFAISDYVDIQGREGVHLRDLWSEKVESYRTMMAPGFPNFFMLLGPNSATGHTSALIMIESQADYVIKCLQMIDKGSVRHLDPDPKAVAQYNARLQRDMKKMVFSGGCGAWYTDDNDHNFTLWPYSATRFIAELRGVKRGEFKPDS